MVVMGDQGCQGVTTRICYTVGVKKKEADSGRAKLEKELRDLVKEIDEEGLLFLLRQAHVLIHNARVDRLNDQGKAAGTASEPVVQKAAGNPVSIEDAGDGKAIFLNLGKARKVLTPEEMKRIVRICYAAETKSEALRQLFTVLARERKDILSDALIGNPDNPLLEELFTVVRERHRLTER
jgi:hypothetical protein